MTSNPSSALKWVYFCRLPSWWHRKYGGTLCIKIFGPTKTESYLGISGIPYPIPLPCFLDILRFNVAIRLLVKPY
tara:strand:- start:906 stop:1130 length:225 start_codon:yes stop_codon:yes gene_type:complete